MPPDANQAILSAISRDEGGIAIVWCPMDLGLRDWLIAEVESLAPSAARPLRTESVEEAIANPDRLVLLVPTDEQIAVEDLDGSRDRIVNGRQLRTQPVVLFLFRGGAGLRALTRAPSLRSVTDGSDPDPEALSEIDVDAERARFEQDNGQSPEDWLAAWRQERIPRTAGSFATAYRALLLERA